MPSTMTLQQLEQASDRFQAISNRYAEAGKVLQARGDFLFQETNYQMYEISPFAFRVFFLKFTYAKVVKIIADLFSSIITGVASLLVCGRSRSLYNYWQLSFNSLKNETAKLPYIIYAMINPAAGIKRVVL